MVFLKAHSFWVSSLIAQFLLGRLEKKLSDGSNHLRALGYQVYDTRYPHTDWVDPLHTPGRCRLVVDILYGHVPELVMPHAASHCPDASLFSSAFASRSSAGFFSSSLIANYLSFVVFHHAPCMADERLLTISGIVTLDGEAVQKRTTCALILHDYRNMSMAQLSPTRKVPFLDTQNKNQNLHK